jgi:hypothetical protein
LSTLEKYVCYIKLAPCYDPEDNELYANKIIQNLLRVSVQVASISDLMAVFSTGIACGFF